MAHWLTDYSITATAELGRGLEDHFNNFTQFISTHLHFQFRHSRFDSLVFDGLRILGLLKNIWTHYFLSSLLAQGPGSLRRFHIQSGRAGVQYPPPTFSTSCCTFKELTNTRTRRLFYSQQFNTRTRRYITYGADRVEAVEISSSPLFSGRNSTRTMALQILLCLLQNFKAIPTANKDQR